MSNEVCVSLFFTLFVFAVKQYAWLVCVSLFDFICVRLCCLMLVVLLLKLYVCLPVRNIMFLQYALSLW